MPNCKSYFDIYTCEKCEEGYYLKLANKSCQLIDLSYNCQDYDEI